MGFSASISEMLPTNGRPGGPGIVAVSEAMMKRPKQRRKTEGDFYELIDRQWKGICSSTERSARPELCRTLPVSFTHETALQMTHCTHRSSRRSRRVHRKDFDAIRWLAGTVPRSVLTDIRALIGQKPLLESLPRRRVIAEDHSRPNPQVGLHKTSDVMLCSGVVFGQGGKSFKAVLIVILVRS